MNKLIVVVAAVALMTSAASAGLINGNFDANSGTPNGWSLWGDGWGGNMDNNMAASGGAIFNPNPTEFGTYSYRCGEWNNTGGSAGIYQQITDMIPGVQYQLAFKIAWGTGANGGWHEVGVTPGLVTNGNGGTLPGGLYKKDNSTEDYWHDEVLTFTPTSNNVTIFIKTGSVGGAWEPIYTWVDEMALTPEPATLGLMLIGFLPLLRRRR